MEKNKICVQKIILALSGIFASIISLRIIKVNKIFPLIDIKISPNNITRHGRNQNKFRRISTFDDVIPLMVAFAAYAKQA